jgi:hypothetical protein
MEQTMPPRSGQSTVARLTCDESHAGLLWRTRAISTWIGRCSAKTAIAQSTPTYCCNERFDWCMPRKSVIDAKDNLRILASARKNWTESYRDCVHGKSTWFVIQGHNMIDRYFKMTLVKVDHDMSLLGRQGSCPGGCIS